MSLYLAIQNEGSLIGIHKTVLVRIRHGAGPAVDVVVSAFLDTLLWSRVPILTIEGIDRENNYTFRRLNAHDALIPHRGAPKASGIRSTVYL